jgi:hypothetical protein
MYRKTPGSLRYLRSIFFEFTLVYMSPVSDHKSIVTDVPLPKLWMPAVAGVFEKRQYNIFPLMALVRRVGWLVASGFL